MTLLIYLVVLNKTLAGSVIQKLTHYRHYPHHLIIVIIIVLLIIIISVVVVVYDLIGESLLTIFASLA